jgi:hypothetical protein
MFLFVLEKNEFVDEDALFGKVIDEKLHWLNFIGEQLSAPIPELFQSNFDDPADRNEPSPIIPVCWMWWIYDLQRFCCFKRWLFLQHNVWTSL